MMTMAETERGDNCWRFVSARKVGSLRRGRGGAGRRAMTDDGRRLLVVQKKKTEERGVDG
jgi:hypothetical protein